MKFASTTAATATGIRARVRAETSSGRGFMGLTQNLRLGIHQVKTKIKMRGTSCPRSYVRRLSGCRDSPAWRVSFPWRSWWAVSWFPSARLSFSWLRWVRVDWLGGLLCCRPAIFISHFPPPRNPGFHLLCGVQVEAKGKPINFQSPRLAQVKDPARNWHRLKLTVRDGAVEVAFDGVVVNRTSKGPRGPGRIVLRDEGYAISFRNLLLFPLPAAPAAAEKQAR